MAEQDSLRPLSGEARDRLLRQSWAANDGLWFYEVARASGIDEANRMNGRVVRSFARLEMARLLRAVGVLSVDTMERYRQIFTLATDMFVKDIFAYEEEVGECSHTLKISRCFAYDGVKRAGMEREYRCGPGQRALGWLDAMRVTYTATPEAGLCQMAHTGQCSYRFELTLPSTDQE